MGKQNPYSLLTGLQTCRAIQGISMETSQRGTKDLSYKPAIQPLASDGRIQQPLSQGLTQPCTLILYAQ